MQSKSGACKSVKLARSIASMLCSFMLVDAVPFVNCSCWDLYRQHIRRFHFQTKFRALAPLVVSLVYTQSLFSVQLSLQTKVGMEIGTVYKATLAT